MTGNFASIAVLFLAFVRPFTSGNLMSIAALLLRVRRSRGVERQQLSESEFAVAGSTLLVVALFAPLRRPIQGAVDRRFYRSRYDATRAPDSLALRLRDQVDLDSLRADLIGAVRQTMSPIHASLWIKGIRNDFRTAGG